MKQNKVFLHHILDEIIFLEKETKEIDSVSFFSNELLKKACARSLEIIGEAVKNLSDDFAHQHDDIEWKKLAGLRDKVIHFYFGVNWDIVWDVIKNKLPEIKEKIEKIIAKT
ncbi:DUF86 domain-containing protein [Candidatus Saganbacteria bacterium]|nr:DUF86 domain-containing protein [Candidatus Saganbacteria bacterium]